jgi:hypothetical protein
MQGKSNISLGVRLVNHLKFDFFTKRYSEQQSIWRLHFGPLQMTSISFRIPSILQYRIVKQILIITVNKYLYSPRL